MHRTTRTLTLALLATACGDRTPAGTGTETDSTGEASTTTGGTGVDTTAGTSESTSTGGEDLPPSSDWCERVVAGPPGRGNPLVELSLAHARIRFFGAEADYPTVDAALADALEPADALDELALALAPYDEALESVCILPAGGGAIGPASVALVGNAAWVRPGTGTIELPAEAEVVVLDLRDLPNVPELPELLAAAVAPAIATPYSRPTRLVRRHNGHVDQTISVMNDAWYFTELAELTPPPIEPAGATDRELVIVTGERLAPAAAELAGSLRLQARAWLVGHDVLAAVAESSFSPIGALGAAYQSNEILEFGSSRWPDVTLADIVTNAPEDVIAEQFPAGPPPPPSYEGAARPRIAQYDPWSMEYGDALGLGEIRSSLVIVHGVLELFFPYFDVVGHGTDDILLELLAETSPTDADDRPRMLERLLRLASVLDDGNTYVSDMLATPLTTGISVRIEALDGYPVVRRTNNPGLAPGDIITEIEGVPALEWYEARHPLVSAATDGYRHVEVTRLWTYRDDAITLGLESAAGVAQTLDVEPVDSAALTELGPVCNRPHGWLDDLGAPGLYFINTCVGTLAEADAAVDVAIAGGATGVVVDARYYAFPGIYSLAERLIPGPFELPRFDIPVRIGPDVYEEQLLSYPTRGSQAYEGPIALIVGNRSQNAGEIFPIVLVGAERATVVGQQSAATAGETSGIELPGGFNFRFGAMRTLFPDGSTFHGVGIVPDVEVPIDPIAYAQGDDPELLAAIDALMP